jgi:hypothetical protein
MEKRIRLVRDFLPLSKLLIKVKISFDRSLCNTSTANFALSGLDKVESLRYFTLFKDEFSERERFWDHVACNRHQM